MSGYSFAAYCRLGVSVWESDRAVIRAARARLKPAARRAPNLRTARKLFYQGMLDYHHEARDVAVAAERIREGTWRAL